MNTTNLFIEILIIGIGGFIALLVVLGAGHLVSWQDVKYWVDTLGNGILITIPFVVYFIGILTDRLADRMLVTLEHQIGQDLLDDPEFHAWNTVEDIKRSRTYVYASSETISHHLDYTRSKIRICRGWVLNAVLLMGALLYYGIARPIDHASAWHLLFIGTSLLALINFWAWSTLTEADYRKIHDYDIYLREALSRQRH